MQRSGVYVKQPTGYWAFMPVPLPPKPAVKIEGDPLFFSPAYDTWGADTFR